MALSITPIKLCQNEPFDAFYTIYSLSFPTTEQKSKDELFEMCKSADYTIFAAYDDTVMAGFCILYHPSNEGFYLLEYIAVHPEMRGKNIGKYLFTFSIKHLYEMHGTKALLIEIDSTKAPSPDNALRIKREYLYRDLGCRKIEPFTYILGIPSNEPLLMDLLVYHPSLEHISKKELKVWVEALYTLVYGCEKNDPRIEQMFNTVPKILHLI